MAKMKSRCLLRKMHTIVETMEGREGRRRRRETWNKKLEEESGNNKENKQRK